MPRMKNGIVKRGRTYTYVTRVRDPATGDSKPRWVSGFTTHAEAVAARDEARAAARRGELITRSKTTVTEFLGQWVEEIDVKPKTRSGYRYHIDRYIVPRMGALQVQDLRPDAITRFYRDLQESGGRGGQGLGWPSIHAVHRTLRAALQEACDQQLVAQNPASRAKLPPKPRPQTRGSREVEAGCALSPSELSALLDVAREHRLGALFHLAAYTGARRGELLHLHWRDIDWSAEILNVAGSRAVVDGKAIEDLPKSGKGRSIGLDAATVATLRTHKASLAEERLRAGALWEDHGDYIFVTERGQPIHQDTPSKLMSKLCEKAGVPRIRFHDLRHTHASILLTAGVPPHEVAERLGHRDATVTLQVYAQVLRERSQGLGGVFAQAARSHPG